MKTVYATLASASPYSQGAAIQSKKNTGENHEAFEERTWRERMHVDNNGEIFIPPMCLKLCLENCARFLSETVPGKGKATYTKHFTAGVMVVEPLMLGINVNDVKGEKLFVPSDGKKGGSMRVWKTFPIIPEWKANCEIILLDPILVDKPAKVEEYLDHAGKFVGLGRFRPLNGGYYGRFKVIDFKS